LVPVSGEGSTKPPRLVIASVPSAGVAAGTAVSAGREVSYLVASSAALGAFCSTGSAGCSRAGPNGDSIGSFGSGSSSGASGSKDGSSATTAGGGGTGSSSAGSGWARNAACIGIDTDTAQSADAGVGSGCANSHSASAPCRHRDAAQEPVEAVIRRGWFGAKLRGAASSVAAAGAPSALAAAVVVRTPLRTAG
jgi:hypothetical protein